MIIVNRGKKTIIMLSYQLNIAKKLKKDFRFLEDREELEFI